MSDEHGWAVVSRTADVLQITLAVFGVLSIVSVALGINILADRVLVSAAVAFAIMGVGSVISGMASTRDPKRIHAPDRGSRTQMLYVTGLVFIVFAAVISVLLLGPSSLAATPICE
jgi:uncharacterized membrane protein YidH (DUF202 family)